MKRPTTEEVEREIAALDTLDIKALQNRWRELFKIEPPRHIRSGFLRRAIAYRLQELVYGGLKPAARRQLQQYADQAIARRGMAAAEPEDGTKPVPSARNRVVLSSGTRLMREWNGVTQVVEVTPNGFLWRGTSYRTLSAVAVAITGTKWSGPKFFGLSGPARPATKVSERSLVRSLAVDTGASQ